MGIKQFFGKSLLKLLQETQKEQEKERDTLRGVEPFNTLEARVRDNVPAIVAYRIANGFIAQSFIGSNYDGRQVPFHYCADHQAVADFIIAEASRQALGLSQQHVYGEQTLAKTSQAIRGASHATVMAKPNY